MQGPADPFPSQIKLDMNSLFLDIVATLFAVIFLATSTNVARHEWRRYIRDRDEGGHSLLFLKLQLIRREFGALIIAAMGILLFLGMNFPQTFTRTPERFFQFWGAFSGCILILLLLGGWDLLASRQEYRKEARSMIRKTLFDVSEEALQKHKNRRKPTEKATQQEEASQNDSEN